MPKILTKKQVEAKVRQDTAAFELRGARRRKKIKFSKPFTTAEYAIVVTMDNSYPQPIIVSKTIKGFVMQWEEPDTYSGVWQATLFMDLNEEG